MRYALSRPVLASAGAIVAAAMTLAACGGSDSSSPSGAAGKERSQEQQSETKLADFAKCMREHGVDAEFQSGQDGGIRIKGSGNGSGPQSMEAAQKACARYQPQPKHVNLSPQQKVEREEAVDKFAKCMREHGIKVEASTQGGGVQIRIHNHRGSGEPNPESPGFQQAQTTCQKLLPGGGPSPGAAKRAGPGSGAESGSGGPASESSESNIAPAGG